MWAERRRHRQGVPDRPATIAQRIVRAKRTLAAAKVRFELPTGPERTARLDAVREVVYLVFNEGYTPTGGEQWVGSELCGERFVGLSAALGVILRDTETLGLLALIELQASRLRARTGPAGEPILLEEQKPDRAGYRLLIRRGLAGLERIEDLGQATGPYALQAQIAACHARATRAVDTDWERITALYDGLARVMPSPVVELNRAVATGRAYGAEAGLAVLQPLLDDPHLRGYHLLPAVAGNLWCRSGDPSCP